MLAQSDMAVFDGDGTTLWKATVSAQGEQSTDVLESIPVLEEEFNLNTRKVPKGRVRVEIRTRWRKLPASPCMRMSLT